MSFWSGCEGLGPQGSHLQPRGTGRGLWECTEEPQDCWQISGVQQSVCFIKHEEFHTVQLQSPALDHIHHSAYTTFLSAAEQFLTDKEDSCSNGWHDTGEEGGSSIVPRLFLLENSESRHLQH